MGSLLDHARSKSTQTRRYLAFAVSFGVVMVIFALWAGVKYMESTVEEEDRGVAESVRSPLDTLMQNSVSAWDDMSSEFSEINTTFQEFFGGVPEEAEPSDDTTPLEPTATGTPENETEDRPEPVFWE